MIAMIVAMDKNNLIGKGNGLPWNYPEDLAYFKKVTSGKIIVMGAKTFDSIGKPLPNRTNYVVTNTPEKYENIDGIIVATDLVKLMESFNKNDEVFVIGGASIYKQTEKYLDELYITFINEVHDGDIYFPKYNWDNFELITREFRGKLTFTYWKRVDPAKRSLF